MIDSTIVKAHRAASGAKGGEKNQAIGISRGGRSTKIHAIVDSKGRPLNFIVTGGQVHHSQVVGDVLDTPKAPLAITADKAYDSEHVRHTSRMKGPFRSSQAAATLAKRPTVQSGSTDAATPSKITSAVSRIGGASQPAMTSSPETTSPRPLSWGALCWIKL